MSLTAPRIRPAAWRVAASTIVPPATWTLNACAGRPGTACRPSASLISMVHTVAYGTGPVNTVPYGVGDAMTPKDDNSLDRERWAAAALDALERGGLSALAVEPLA